MRVPVPLRSAYKLLNHGPTTLITRAFADRRNVMAAAWVMAIDFEPPKVAAVVVEDTFTRELILASNELVVHAPTRAQLALTYSVGSVSGREVDKIERFAIATAEASEVRAP